MRLILPLLPLCLAAAEPAAAPPASAEVKTETTTSDGTTTVRVKHSHHIGVEVDRIGDEPAEEGEEVSGPWRLGSTGIRFGGIIGASVGLGLRYDPGWQVQPELAAAAGISGAKVSLGARWQLTQRHWKLDAGGVKLDGDSSTTLTPRAVAFYRWEDEHRHPTFWRGMPVGDDWHLGGELGVCLKGLALDVAATWRRGASQPDFTLAYGLSF